MSIMNLGRRNGNETGNGIPNGSERVEPTPPFPPPPVLVSEPDPDAVQLQLASVTLEAVDRLTGMTAEEIERLAERVLDGAQETEAVLRQLAWCVRENGLFASERLDHFVRVSNQCAEIARSMQECVNRRDELPPPEPMKPEPIAAREPADAAAVDHAPALGAIEQATEKTLGTVRSRARRRRGLDRPAPADQPTAPSDQPAAPSDQPAAQVRSPI